MAATYTVRTLDRLEVDQAVEWAAAEGWNPGQHDADCFCAVDPGGFIGGFLDGEMIASISVVNYDSQFSFLGFYIVAEPHRGQGYGYRLWQQAIKHAGDRLIGLDGVVAEQDNYRRAGFELAYRNVRYGGQAPTELMDTGAGGVHTLPLEQLDAETIAFDRKAFPAARTPFLQCWLNAPGHVARAAWADNTLAGYGVIRRCRSGFKIGPLFAVDQQVAKVLAAELVASRQAEPVSSEIYIDVPEPNSEAVALAEALGLAPVFETARMYTGQAPSIALERVFGVSSFELG